MIKHALILTLVAAATACNGGSSTSGTDTDTDTDSGTTTATTSTSGPTTSTSTSSTSSTSTTTGNTTGTPDDYWHTGKCLGPQNPSSDDCMDVDLVGKCDDQGRVIYCEQGELYCIDCEGNGAMCGFDPTNQWYDCLPPGGDSGTSTGTGTGTGTGTSTGG